ncbi:smooth septate junction protein snakeskin [Arctopsyche grandis]|uniref:smooth septate junction protein snakeskin n=1 Tax=Arctopsyche grandis TaxID=121162 RepID=UPI00406D8FF3
MVSIQTIGSVMIKLLKLVLNLLVLILYRTGYAGQFLGVSGQWNFNEVKIPDAEIFASGVFVGYFIYTSVQLVSYCFGAKDHQKQLTDTMMNFVGIFLWIAVGGMALHYWHGYMGEQHYKHIYSERQVGLALGSLCVLNGAAHLLDTVLALAHFSQ